MSMRLFSRLRRREPRERSDLGAALFACRNALFALGVASALVNVLYLTGSIYMLEVYDRVLPSRSVATLVGLSILAASLYAYQSILDVLRGRILVRVGRSVGQSLSSRTFESLARMALHSRRQGDSLQPVRDLDQIRTFLSGSGPLALLDLPWMPVYIAICFAFHVWMGITAVIGALLLIGLTALTEVFMREPAKFAMDVSTKRNALAEAAHRNAEVVHAMGMAPQLGTMWNEVSVKFFTANQRAADVSGSLGALAKMMRMALQSTMLGVGALLVIKEQATAGVMIASSIIIARALAPVDLAIANWRGFVACRQSWRRLNQLLEHMHDDTVQVALPKPENTIAVDNLSVVPPGTERLVVQDVSFRLDKGSALGIIGPSASGKSSLARALVGIWHPVRGTVRLDGAALDQWSTSALGRHIGFLPQDVELFAGTVAQNIGRLETPPDSQAVIAAAKAAGVHEMILHLPEGYETQVGEGGAALSAGQRQRIGLARALYRDPFLVVLDEPNSNLDLDGEQALTQAIAGIRARGGVVIVIAHRPSALANVNFVLLLMQGKIQLYGPRDQVIAKLRSPAPSSSAGLKVVGAPGGDAL
jgi:ATP-binding cassette subfamily C protein